MTGSVDDLRKERNKVQKEVGMKIAYNRPEWMTKTFLDRITLTMQFSKGSV
jgi:hypothetical protein